MRWSMETHFVLWWRRGEAGWGRTGASREKQVPHCARNDRHKGKCKANRRSLQDDSQEKQEREQAWKGLKRDLDGRVWGKFQRKNIEEAAEHFVESRVCTG